MYIDGTTVNENAEIETDVCIIGAGAAGITLALSFLNKSYSVCILESGGFEYEPETQNLYEGNAMQSFNNSDSQFMLRNMSEYLMSSRLRYFGGTTNHWSGMCRPLNAIDFEKRDEIPYSGWPISLSELTTYYEKAASIVEISPFTDGRVEQEIKNKLYKIGDESVFENKIFYFGPPTRFGKRYYKDFETVNNIKIYYHSNVIQLIIDKIDSTIAKVKVATLKKTHFFVKSKIFVLATGGIENARILLNSNQERTNGLGNENDLVGRFFMEHIEHEFGGMYVNSPLNSLYFYGSPTFIEKYKHSVYPVLFLNENIQKREGLLSCSIRIDHWDMKENKPAFLPLSDFNKRVIYHARGLDNLVIGSKSSRLLKRFIRNNKMPLIANYAHLFIVQEHAPNPNSRVMLDNDEDIFGVKRVKLNWQLSDYEFKSIQRHLYMMAQELGRSSQGRVFIDFDLEKPKSVGYGWHHMGTTRMHNDSKQGIVDKFCKMHSVKNCYIAGSSVFPTCGSINPTLTIVALSLRIADQINKELEK